jgi:hypothetical protein
LRKGFLMSLRECRSRYYFLVCWRESLIALDVHKHARENTTRNVEGMLICHSLLGIDELEFSNQSQMQRNERYSFEKKKGKKNPSTYHARMKGLSHAQTRNPKAKLQQQMLPYCLSFHIINFITMSYFQPASPCQGSPLCGP